MAKEVNSIDQLLNFLDNWTNEDTPSYVSPGYLIHGVPFRKLIDDAIVERDIELGADKDGDTQEIPV